MFQPFRNYTSPWRDLERLRREWSQLLGSFPTSSSVASGYPAMNVWMNEDGVIITAELPGVNPEDIEISVVDDTLTLSGNRAPVELEEKHVYHRRERKHGKFARTFRIPYKIEAGKVEASFTKGVLNITLPRAEEDKPKKITIKTG